MEEKKNPIIEMVDNNGNTVHAELYDIFEFEGRKYALLVPVEEEQEEGHPSIAVMRLMEDGDSYYIEEIPTDEEFERISAYLNGPVREDDKNCDCELRAEQHHCCGGHHDDDDCCCGGHHHDDDDCCCGGNHHDDEGCCGGGHCCEH